MNWSHRADPTKRIRQSVSVSAAVVSPFLKSAASRFVKKRTAIRFLK